MNIKKICLFFCLYSIFSGLAYSQNEVFSIPGVLNKTLIKHVLFTEKLANDPEIIKVSSGVSASNTDLMAVIQKDTSWPVSSTMQKEVIGHALAKSFRSIINDDKYEIVEIMLTDKLGGLIAAYPLPSDYWQGDEEKFILPLMKNGKHITNVKWDESTRRYSFFISIPIVGDKKKLFGVMIVGVDVTSSVIPDLE